MNSKEFHLTRREFQLGALAAGGDAPLGAGR
jgi:hypothetical protein